MNETGTDISRSMCIVVKLLTYILIKCDYKTIWYLYSLEVMLILPTLVSSKN